MMLPSCTDESSGRHANTPENNFEQLWREFDRSYAHFQLKNIDWDSQYRLYRPKVTPETTDAELFNILSDMIASLKDPHVRLRSNTGMDFRYDPMNGRRVNFPGISAIVPRYLHNYENNRTIGSALIDGNIGYIYIGSFDGTPDTFAYIDVAIRKFESTNGVIIDIRNNGGGNDSNAGIVAGRFVNEKKLFRYVKFKSGSLHNDFTDFIPGYITSAGPIRYFNPVIVLTNRGCASSTESFILQLKTMSTVRVVGDTTSGSSGNPAEYELPNGWKYQVSRWIEFKPDKTTFEGVGLFPDVPVWISKEDMAANRDTILERAIELLKK